MTYRLSSREFVEIISAVYDRYHFIADQLYDPSIPFPTDTLVHWIKAGYVAHEVNPSYFIYCNSKGRECHFNPFVFGRLQLALERNCRTYDEIVEMAVYSPLFKPDFFAMKVVEMNLKDYLRALGGEELLRFHYPILDILLSFHRHDLHPLVLTSGELDKNKIVDSYEGLASELYHRIDQSHDWHEIANFLARDPKQQSEGHAILEKYGRKMVYKMPLASACDGCRKLYLESNGHPRLFPIEDLLANGPLTIPMRTGEHPCDVPTCGPSHLLCDCSGPFLVTGMEWWYEEQEKPAPKACHQKTSPNESIVLSPSKESILKRFTKFMDQFVEK